YGVNTLGAALAGLLLLPLLGLRGLLIAGALLDAGLGIALLHRAGRRSPRARRLSRLATGSMAALVAVVLMFLPLAPPPLTRGVYRSGLLANPEGVRILSYRD